MGKRKPTIWVLTTVDSGVVNGIYTNAGKDIDVRAAVVDTDVDYDDRLLMEAEQERLHVLEEDGRMREIQVSPRWTMLESKTGLCVNADVDENCYGFYQPVELPDGGYGIATTGAAPIYPERIKINRRKKYIKKADWRLDDDRLDTEFSNVYAAQCIFQCNLKKYMMADLRFDTLEQAWQYMADWFVDCFLYPEIMGDELDNESDPCNINHMPVCVDVERAMTDMDMDTLVCLALCFNIYVANRSHFQPDHPDFSLEAYLAMIPLEEIQSACSEVPKTGLRKDLEEMKKSDVVDLLLAYNRRLKDEYRHDFSILGVEDLDSFLGLYQEGLV